MANIKPSILFISTQLPFPPKSGGTVKSWNYVKDLSARYKLSVACLLKDDDDQFVESFKSKLPLANLITHAHQTSRSITTLLKSYLGHACLNVYRNHSKTFRNQLSAVLKEVEAVIIDHYEMFQYVPVDFTGKVILHTHNAEFMLWQRMNELESNPFKKLILRLEAKRVAKFEQEIFNRSDLIYTTESDQELYRKHSFQLGNIQVTYHLGNDTLLDLPNIEFSSTELAITFMGTLSWEPNVDGLLWFIENVYPKVLKKHPNCKLYVLGKDPDARLLKAAQSFEFIVFTGFVKELDSYLKKTRVYIAPLRFGSGMKVKVLEGLYRGVPTVSTSVGAEGLKVEDNKHIMIANEPDTFAGKCIRLLEDEKSWNSLLANSRQIARQEYQWIPLFERMDIELKKVL